MSSSRYNGSEKRTYIRVSYGSKHRPQLNIGQIDLDVVDISESGIRIVNDEGLELNQRIHGTMALLCGESVAINGNVVWDKDGEAGVLLAHLIPSEAMEKEKQHVILKSVT